MVWMSVFLRRPTTLPTKFFTKCLKVTPMPSAMAGRYICWLRLPGRVTTLTPMAMTFSLYFSEGLQLCPEDDDRGADHARDRQRQQALPAQLHQLIGAEAGQRPADQQLEGAEDEDLDGPQREHRHDEQHVRQVREQEAIDERPPVPAAEEQRDHDGAGGDDLQELTQEEQAEAQTRVLDEVADDLQLALGDVERRALRLGDGGGEKQQEADRLREDAPAGPPVVEVQEAGLEVVDRAGLQRAVDEKRPQHRHAHRNLIQHHLRAGAQAAHHGPLVVRGPAGQRRPVHRQRGDGEVEQQADVQVRDLQRHRLVAGGARLQQLPPAQRRAERDDGGHDQGRCHGHDRRPHEQELVRHGRHEVLLEHELQRVGQEVRDAPGLEGTDVRAVRSQPVLHHRRLPALQPGQDRRHRHQEAQDHEQDLGHPGQDREHQRSVTHLHYPRELAKRSWIGSDVRPQSAFYMKAIFYQASRNTARAVGALALPLNSIGMPSRCASSVTISQPGSASPAGGTTTRMRWTVPWRLVNVPSTSAQSARGRATWAALTSGPRRQPSTISACSLLMGTALVPASPSTPSSPTTSSVVMAPLFRSLARSIRLFRRPPPMAMAPAVFGFLSALTRMLSLQPWSRPAT